MRLLCDALDVSPAGSYAWCDRPASARQQRQDALLVEIRAIHAEVKARYGSQPVAARTSTTRMHPPAGRKLLLLTEGRLSWAEVPAQ